MSNIEWYDISRVLTFVMTLVALYFSIKRSMRLWDTYKTNQRELIWVLNAFMILLIEASLEGILLDAPGGPRVVLSFVVSFGCLRVILSHEGFFSSEKQ